MADGVTIKLQEKPKDKGGENAQKYNGDPTGSNKEITVTKSEELPSFLKYIHVDSVSNGESPFKLKEIWDYGNHHISVIPPTPDVTSVSAYYWKDENGPGGGKSNNALLVGVETGTITQYYRNSKEGNWKPYDLGVPHGEKPTQAELELLNCEVNNAVIIDLTKDTHRGGSSYCCAGHKEDSSKVTVSEVQVRCQEPGHTSTPISFFKHTLSGPGTKIYDIRYEGGSPRKSIKISENQASYFWCQAIYALYCEEKNPVLVYVDSPNQDNIKGWYQKNKDSESEWTKVDTGLQVITPEELGRSTDHGKYNDLVGLLNNAGCNRYQTCKEIPPLPAGKFVGAELATAGLGIWSISGISSGTLAGAGATFFGGWKIYNRYKGDPWVRQI